MPDKSALVSGKNSTTVNKGPSAPFYKPKWIEALERQLETEESNVTQGYSARNTKKSEINREIAENFWHLWLRFNGIGAVMTIQPPPENFITFKVFPEEWSIKPGYEFGGLDTLALVDMTQEQNRVGDSLIANFYTGEGDDRFRLVFEFIEGERYHKYSGWKKHVARYILFDAPVRSFPMGNFRKSLGAMAKVWFGSHLRRNRKIAVEFVRKNYRLAVTFIK
jgi:hypothetical protein